MKDKTVANIVIVDYHKGARVVQNVKQLQQQSACPTFEICIVDNSCNEHNVKLLADLNQYRNVHISINDSNTGYIQSCNQAASKFDSKYIILVNPDISWVENTTINELIFLMDNNPDIGIAGPRQINDDGTTPDTVRAFPNLLAQILRRTPLRNLSLLKPLVRHYEMANFDYSKSQYVDWIQSSLLIIRRDLWDRVGGLDKSYFLFMSDPDICFKAWKFGYKVFYTAESIVGADGKRCSAGGLKDIFVNKALQHHIKDAIYYQLKYLFKKNPRNT